MPRLEPANANEPRLPVVIYSDVICPWCFVGKRRLEAALATPGMPASLEITWRPFELNPDMPDEGMDRSAYRARKFGEERARSLDAEMAETGRDAGIVFDFGSMRRTPSTRLAHRLIWAAEHQGRGAQNALVERLFQGYFEEGRDIGERQTLLAIAEEAGLEAGTTRRALDDEASLAAVRDLEKAGIRMGIRGVPFFILIGKYAISGAQPPELWRDALPRIAAEASAAGRA